MRFRDEGGCEDGSIIQAVADDCQSGDRHGVLRRLVVDRRISDRSTRPVALHAVLQSWIILRLGRRGLRDHSITPSRKRSAVPSS